MTHYAQLTKNLTPKDGKVIGSIPDGWRQGRTAYGGVTSALSYEAAKHDFPETPQLRSAMINFIGPVYGDPVFSSKLLRRGKNVTSVQTDANVDEGCVATSTFIFAAKRESVLQAGFPAPEAPTPANSQDFAPKEFQKFLPAFIQNFEVKFIAGSRPAMGADEGYMRVWARHSDPASQTGMASLLCIGDILPPAAAARMKQMGPISSVNWMMNVLAEPVTKDGWWHIESRETATSGGYSSQVMRFWNTDGVLVAEGMQAVAIFV